MKWSDRKKKLIFYIIAIQEAFVAMVPFFLLSSMVTLLYYALKYYHPSITFIRLKDIELFMTTLHRFTSVAAVASIAYFVAKRRNVSQIIAILLSLAVFVTIVFIEQFTDPIKLPYGFTAGVLYAPIVSTLLLAALYPRFSLNLPSVDGNRHIYRLFDYLFVFFIAYFATMLFYIIAEYFVDWEVPILHRAFSALPDMFAFYLRDLFVQLFWFVGIHGSHITNAIVGKEILFQEIFPHLTYVEFNRLFVTLGGAGVGVALLVALLYTARERTYKYLTRLSIPFVLFNINTLLVYPIVVFNRSLFVPFVLVPLSNFLAGYLFVNLVPIHWADAYIPWTTPPLLNAYLKSGGDFRLVSFQLMLMLIDTAVYIYFVKRFFKSQSMKEHAWVLGENLNVSHDLEANEGVSAYTAHHEVIEANVRLGELLPTLNEENLSIYYQPKVRVDDHACNTYEALIRYRNNGRLTGPVFLESIEQAGLAPIVDVWVSQRVRRDLALWKEEGFTPEISINLHPDTLLDSKAIESILTYLKGERIKIEILERSFILGEKALENLQRLQEGGFAISIDDFGVGYSNLETIIKHNIQEIKLDKLVIDMIESRNGYLVCKKIVELCHEIGHQVVAEGVERGKQYSRLVEIGVDYIQGFYFTPALPRDEARRFAEALASSRG